MVLAQCWVVAGGHKALWAIWTKYSLVESVGDIGVVITDITYVTVVAVDKATSWTWIPVPRPTKISLFISGYKWAASGVGKSWCPITLSRIMVETKAMSTASFLHSASEGNPPEVTIYCAPCNSGICYSVLLESSIIL